MIICMFTVNVFTFIEIADWCWCYDTSIPDML